MPPGFVLFRESFTELLDRFEVEGPICHVGAKDHARTPEAVKAYRAIFSRCGDGEVVGLDLFAGLKVDVATDLCAPDLFEQHADLQGRFGFGFVFCSAPLEHVRDPFAAAANTARLPRAGGQLYYTGPRVWGYHAYPDDYWRISFSGPKALFPGIEWRRAWYSGARPGVGITFEGPVQERAAFQMSRTRGGGAMLSEKAAPNLNVNAIGRLKLDSPAS